MKATFIKMLIAGALLLSATAALPLESDNSAKFDGNPYPCYPIACPPGAAR